MLLYKQKHDMETELMSVDWASVTNNVLWAFGILADTEQWPSHEAGATPISYLKGEKK